MRSPKSPDAVPCPVCRKPAKAEFQPFCSTRCADIDLGRWLTDRYAIPTPIDEDEDDRHPPADSDRPG